MKYFLLLLVGMVYYSVPYAPEVLATVVAGMAAFYYYLCLSLVVGLKTSSMVANTKSEIQSTVLIVFTNLVSTATVFTKTPYEWVAIVSIPWIVMTFLVMILSVLVYFEILEITDKKDEEEE